eukprot:1819234-Prymnesium_polylepis.1
MRPPASRDGSRGTSRDVPPHLESTGTQDDTPILRCSRLEMALGNSRWGAPVPTHKFSPPLH